MGHDGWIVLIGVVHCQHGGLFMRFSWDLGILVLDNSIVDIETRASSSFREFGSIVEQLVEG